MTNNSFDKLPSTTRSSHKDRVIEKLGQENIGLKGRLLEERFYWTLGLIILIDIFFFPSMQTWGGPIAILVLEVIGLMALARKCKVDGFVEIIERILSILGRKRNIKKYK